MSNILYVCFQWFLVHLNLEILDKSWKMIPKNNKTFLTIFQRTELDRICFPNKVYIQISMKFIFKDIKQSKRNKLHQISKTFPHVIHSTFFDKTITPHQIKGTSQTARISIHTESRQHIVQ